jgi:hypothetical protein
MLRYDMNLFWIFCKYGIYSYEIFDVLEYIPIQPVQLVTQWFNPCLIDSVNNPYQWLVQVLLA